MTDCGPNQYIKWNLDANPPTSTCKNCYQFSPGEEDDITDENSLVNFFRSKERDPSTDATTREQFGDLTINYRQCENYKSYTGTGTAAIAKLAANRQRIRVDTGTWEALQIVENQPIQQICENPDTDYGIDTVRVCEIIGFYKNSEGYLSSDELEAEIRRQFGTANQVNTSGSIDYTLPNLPQEYGGNNTLQDYKNAIHSKRGRYIAENPSIRSYLRGYWNREREGQGVTYPFDSEPSPENIIIEEIYDFWVELNRAETTQPSGIDGINLSSLFSTSNTEFEICMNNLLSDKISSGNNYDSDIQEQINKIDNVVNLRETHINYIEDKLRAISSIDPKDATQCMDILNICETLGNSSISDKMLKMAFLVFHIIGMNQKTFKDLENVTPGDPNYRKLKRILDRLIPYTRSAVKNIIKISKHYEIKTCGYNTATTHILEVIYNDLFEKSREVSIHFDATDMIPDYLIKDSSIMEFVRVVILMVIAICAVYVLLMVLNRPPYPVPSK